MKTSFQLLLDKKLGALINLGLYVPVRILGKILRINHDLNRSFKHIVVAKYKGMGSIVQASALLQTLRNAYPDAEISFISTKTNRGILNYYSTNINRVIEIDDGTFSGLLLSSIKAIIYLWKKRPDLFIDLEIYSNYGTFISTMSAAKNRMGFYKSDKDYRTGLYTHLMVYNIKAPLSEIYLQTARMLGLKSLQNTLVYPEMKDDAVISTYEKTNLSNANYIVINPNASDLRLERRWPSNYFKQLCIKLLEIYPNKSIVFIGNKQEQEYVSEISSFFTFEQRVKDVSGKLSLAELIELLRAAELIITNDTGPLHLSLSLRKNTIGLFGPCSPLQYGQMEYCTPVYLNLYCSPCVHEFIQPPCGGDNRCMKDMQVEHVLMAVRKAYSHEKESFTTNISYVSNSFALGSVENRKK